MNKLNSEKKLCLQCMDEHDVHTVSITEKVAFKGKNICYNAIYEYCENSDELMETEEMIKENKLAMIDNYRVEVGLMTSLQVSEVREKYTISQKDFSEVLDWGRATITRYENHQVQDRAHDDVLRMAASDPKWFLEKLVTSKNRLSAKAFNKYTIVANNLYKEHMDLYLREAIEADYVNCADPDFCGNSELNIDKVIDLVNYLALKVKSLHKVKLMKLLWYADTLNFKRVGHSITGLRYNALPMGAVPEAYDKIVALKDIVSEEVQYDNYEHTAQKFSVKDGFEIKYLTEKEIAVVDTIIDFVGDMKTKQIVEKMHEEDAYKFTDSRKPISYKYAEKLSIN